MDKVKKVKTAVVGCGMISNIYIRSLKNLFYIIDLVAVCDLLEEAALRQQAAFGVSRVMTIDEIANSDEIELVVNLTGPVAHYDVIKKMLLAGKHVYTEKMFTTELEKAKELVKLADEKGLYLGVAPDTILGAGTQTARKVLDAGFIGDITSVQVHVNRNQSLNSETYKFLKNDGGSLPYDVGVYYVGTLLALLGPVKRVMAVGRSAPVHFAEHLYDYSPEEHWQVPGNNVLSACLEFESGVAGSVLFDGNTTNSTQHGFTIYGTKGILEVGDPNEFNGITRLILPESEPSVIPYTHGYNGVNTLGGEPVWYDGYGNRGIGVAEMAWAIRKGRKNNRCSKEYGLHCMEVLIGMEESARTGSAYEPKSRFRMDPLVSGYYSTNGGARGDAERSLMD